MFITGMGGAGETAAGAGCVDGSGAFAVPTAELCGGEDSDGVARPGAGAGSVRRCCWEGV